MRALPIACSLAVACLSLQACGGTAFDLPLVSEREALLAAQELDADPALPKFPRSSAYYREAIHRIDTELTQHVGSICVRARTEDCRFYFHYVNDDDVNAYTDVNGQIYLHRGLLVYLDSDDEIAGVMAHEMGHQIANHVQEGMGSALLGGLVGGLLLGGAAVATGTPADEAEVLADEGVEYGAQVGVLSFSKEQEREADLLAAYVVARSSYDLDRAGRTFEVLARLDNKTQARWNDTHPAGPERIVAWRKAVAEARASKHHLPTMIAP